MSIIHEVATITSKGQITLPKPIRQALGVDVGGKVAFDFIGDSVIVSRANDEPHNDPSIGCFLALLEEDIRSGRRITSLPEDLSRSMLAALGRNIDTTADIDGDVEL
jgi:antitoxin PrlF